MSRLRTLAIAAPLLLATAGFAAAASCTAEVGRKEAAILVQRCTEISPATRPPCNATNSCALIRDEIKRGCDLAGSDAPDWCESDDDED